MGIPGLGLQSLGLESRALLAPLRPHGGALPGMRPNVTHKGQLVAPIADRAHAAAHSPNSARRRQVRLAQRAGALLFGDAHEASGLALQCSEIKPRDLNPWAFRQRCKPREHMPMGCANAQIQEFHAVELESVGHGAAGRGRAIRGDRREAMCRRWNRCKAANCSMEAWACRIGFGCVVQALILTSPEAPGLESLGFISGRCRRGRERSGRGDTPSRPLARGSRRRGRRSKG